MTKDMASDESAKDSTTAAATGTSGTPGRGAAGREAERAADSGVEHADTASAAERTDGRSRGVNRGRSYSPAVESPSSGARRARKDRESMRVLVTGHHGYLGSVLMPLLAGAGHEATGLDSDLFERCLLGDTLAATGIFDRTYLTHLVDAHQSGARDYSAALWTVMMFEAFLRNQQAGAPAVAREPAEVAV